MSDNPRTAHPVQAMLQRLDPLARFEHVPVLDSTNTELMRRARAGQTDPVLLVADGVLSLGFLPRAWVLARRRDVALMASGAVIGVPLGVRVSRRETTAGLGIATGLALGYYFLTVMVGWLSRPPAERPAVVAFYLEEVNGAGHRFGPESPEVAAAVRKVCYR